MKNLLIIGGSGQLGKTVLHTFKTQSPKWNTFNVDFRENSDTTHNFVLTDKWKTNPDIVSQIQVKFAKGLRPVLFN